MEWKHVVVLLGLVGFLAAFLLGILVDRMIDTKEELCEVRERVSSIECEVERKGE